MRYQILLVEDHGDSARALSILLRTSGHKVRIATTAAAAFEAFMQEDFDVLLCDLGLPDKDGCDLLQEMLKHRPIRAIAVTGFGMIEDVERSASAGFLSHVTKPVSLEGLKSVMNALAAYPDTPGNRIQNSGSEYSSK